MEEFGRKDYNKKFNKLKAFRDMDKDMFLLCDTDKYYVKMLTFYCELLENDGRQTDADKLLLRAKYAEMKHRANPDYVKAPDWNGSEII